MSWGVDSRVLRFGVALAAVLSSACEKSSSLSDAGLSGSCGPGMIAVGPACAPVFSSSCKPDELPLRGGGCRRVGVREHDAGLCGPGDAGCRRIGVEECDGGLRGPPDWTCKAIGPPGACRSDWTLTARGWCEPILPTSTCGTGTLALLGKADCQPIGDCGSGTWGKIKTNANTIHVNPAYPGGGSDGSSARPYTTISAAQKVAGTAPHLALAAGTYAEDVRLTHDGALLEGRCARMVTIKGRGVNQADALWITGKGTTVRGVTVTGPNRGIDVRGDKTTLQQVEVSGCGKAGLHVWRSALTARELKLAGNTGDGMILAAGASATLDRVVVRDTRPSASSPSSGIGIWVEEWSSLVLRDSLVSANNNSGINLSAGLVTVERSVVRETRQGDVGAGYLTGYGIWSMSPAGQTPSVTVKDSVLAKNVIGLGLGSAHALVERTVIRDSVPGLSGYAGGIAAYAVPAGASGPPSRLNIKGSLISHSTPSFAHAGSAVHVTNSTASLERTVVQHTSPAKSARSPAGTGIGAHRFTGFSASGTLSITDCLISGNTFAGIFLQSVSSTVERTVLRGNRASPEDGKAGHGLFATIALGNTHPATVSLKHCLVSGNQEAGLLLGAGHGTLDRTVVRDNLPRPSNKQLGVGIYLQPDIVGLTPSSLTARDSLVAGNSMVGVVVHNSDLTLDRCVVRDTRPIKDTGLGGIGIEATIGTAFGSTRAPSVVVRDSLFSRNRYSAITSSGRTVLERSAILDTGPHPKNGTFGYGLSIISLGEIGKPVPLTISDSLIARSSNSGIVLWGSQADIRRSAVRDTAASDQTSGGGAGIQVLPQQEGTYNQPSRLLLEDALVEGSGVVGLGVAAGSSATVKTSAVRRTRGVGGSYGDGISASSQGSRLVLLGSQVSGSARAGLLISNAGGAANRSLFESNLIAIYLKGTGFTVAGDNLYRDNKENGVSREGNLSTAKLPPLPPFVPSR